MTTNILIAGVGGQGLVLATRIVGTVAYRAGLDVKTCDVIGLAQRGGMVWGSVRLGNRRLANTVLLGVLATYLPFATDTWLEVLRESVPNSTIELNEAAFAQGTALTRP